MFVYSMNLSEQYLDMRGEEGNARCDHVIFMKCAGLQPCRGERGACSLTLL